MRRATSDRCLECRAGASRDRAAEDRECQQHEQAGNGGEAETMPGVSVQPGPSMGSPEFSSDGKDFQGAKTPLSVVTPSKTASSVSNTFRLHHPVVSHRLRRGASLTTRSWRCVSAKSSESSSGGL